MSHLARNDSYKPALFWLCAGVLVWSALGLLAGGWTTTINGGMAFLDWPLSNGSVNPDGFLKMDAAGEFVAPDKNAEHLHRLLMGFLGLFCIGIAGWTHYAESRAWVRKIAYGLPALVLFQGVLGGARVLFDPMNFKDLSGSVSRTFAISHAVTALLTVGLLTLLVTAQSRRWFRPATPETPVGDGLRKFAVFTAVAIWIQALLGALVRQHRWSIWDMAGRKPDAETLPYLGEWATGKFLARMSSGWPFALNAAHRIGALVVTLLVAALVTRILTDAKARRAAGVVAGALALAILAQVSLGVIQIWFNANTAARNAHHLGGALVFCLAASVAMYANRDAILAKNHRA